MEPWFRLDMRLGEGSGCTMAFSVMEAACVILDRMATFERAGIDDSYLEDIRKPEKKRTRKGKAPKESADAGRE
jgi:nicotinate-nucleotide--dimethylbenzimidazole phosphoribosyltransferase